MHKHLLFIFICAICLFNFSQCRKKQKSPRRPHVVFVMADDFGYNDIGYHAKYHGSQLLTPFLDNLAGKLNPVMLLQFVTRKGGMFRKGISIIEECSLSKNGCQLKFISILWASVYLYPISRVSKSLSPVNRLYHRPISALTTPVDMMTFFVCLRI